MNEKSGWPTRKNVGLKFTYSEKATKLDFSHEVASKSTVEDSQNFVAFSEYMIFKKDDNTRGAGWGKFFFYFET